MRDDRTHGDTGMLTTNAGGQLVVRTVRVTVVEGPDAGLSIELERGTRVVGSGPAADLRLTDPRVSRAHLELALLGHGVHVRDLGSRNGTFVGDARVGALTISGHGLVRLGKTTTIELVPADAPAVAPARTRFGDLVAANAAMTTILGVLARVAPTDSPVLLEGEDGVGKTAAAHALHAHGARKGELAILDLSIDAQADIARCFEASGTLLLERVDHATAAAQTKLRAALEAREARGTGPRIVATSREDMRRLVEDGAFSRDLYFHLSAVHLRLPPLRERPDDVPVLVDALRARYGSAAGASEIAELRGLGFPGNVRALRGVAQPAIEAAPPIEELGYKAAKDRVLERFEKDYLEGLLAEHRGNVSKAARAADMSRTHLIDLLKKHGLG